MKQIIPNLNSYINEMSVPYLKWIDVEMKTLDEPMMTHIWHMYTTTYSEEGLDFSANDMYDLQQKYSAILLMDTNKDKIPNAFIIYKKTEFGNKIALSGNDGSKDAKMVFMKKLVDLVIKSKGWYVEGSKKIDDFLVAMNAPFVNDEQTVRTILGKDILWKENGYYSRKLSRADKYIDKRMYGKPKI